MKVIAKGDAHVAIMDDVVTTGSTVYQLCQLLLEVGVKGLIFTASAALLNPRLSQFPKKLVYQFSKKGLNYRPDRSRMAE